MLRQICILIALVAIAQSSPIKQSFKELPCLGKLAGQRLPHPTDPHKFLRCVAADSAWIETCPDELFYNPHSEICDWDQIEKITTPASKVDVVKHRPVLVKFRPVDETSSQSRTVSVETTVLDDEAALLTTPAPVTTVAPVVQVVTNSIPQQFEFVPATTPAVEFVVQDSVPVFEAVATTIAPVQFVAPVQEETFVAPVQEEVTFVAPVKEETTFVAPVQQQTFVAPVQQQVVQQPQQFVAQIQEQPVVPLQQVVPVKPVKQVMPVQQVPIQHITNQLMQTVTPSPVPASTLEVIKTF